MLEHLGSSHSARRDVLADNSRRMSGRRSTSDQLLSRAVLQVVSASMIPSIQPCHACSLASKDGMLWTPAAGLPDCGSQGYSTLSPRHGLQSHSRSAATGTEQQSWSYWTRRDQPPASAPSDLSLEVTSCHELPHTPPGLPHFILEMMGEGRAGGGDPLTFLSSSPLRSVGAGPASPDGAARGRGVSAVLSPPPARRLLRLHMCVSACVCAHPPPHPSRSGGTVSAAAPLPPHGAGGERGGCVVEFLSY